MADTLHQIKSLGAKAGIVLNPETSVKKIEPFLPLADLVLVMSVHPGYSGQAFMPEAIEKVAQVRKNLDSLNSTAWLQVDGGITADTLPKMKAAGTDVFVAASAIFRHPEGIAAGIQALREAGG
jgi:ribulose-phosphate 3-epimerase